MYKEDGRYGYAREEEVQNVFVIGLERLNPTALGFKAKWALSESVQRLVKRYVKRGTPAWR